ncbi:nuclear transport factor 2 family protein [Blastomonas sp.]|uniref:nuclear transport factor 2 family protein n=1 Tax=Blastomonas sp. TaxID=1909299 RepID=UPI00260590A1|nr:nuclear transport factor 2 family protein [Blastomonas sp.]MDM7955097.1 nuclear transport factor 2 family protein [Blastomonas sp.]
MSRIAIFEQLVQWWNAGEIDGVLDLMTDDVRWHVAAGAFGPISGKPAVRSFLAQLRTDMAETQWRILRHAEAPGLLFVEGVDGYRMHSGVTVEMPYAAVIEFDGDCIAAWRDYLDTRRMEKLREGKPAPDHVRALVA